MKTRILVGLLFGIFLTGCATPQEEYSNEVDEGGSHLMSERPHSRHLTYHKRAVRRLLRRIQRRNLDYEETLVAIEQYANLKYYTALHGLNAEELEWILGEINGQSSGYLVGYPYWYNGYGWHGGMGFGGYGSIGGIYYRHQTDAFGNPWLDTRDRFGFGGAFATPGQSFLGGTPSAVYPQIVQPPFLQGAGGANTVYQQIIQPPQPSVGGRSAPYPRISLPSHQTLGGQTMVYPQIGQTP